MRHPVTFYSFVEDVLTRQVVIRLISRLKAQFPFVSLADGNPVVTQGSGRLKEKAQKFRDAAQHGIDSLLVTDLDTWATPNDLGRDWFGVLCLSELPDGFIFRIAVREIESWILADKDGLARYLLISPDNFPDNSDAIPDPKQFLLNLVATKCRRKRFRDMLPLKGQKIGIGYNPVLSDFIDNHWDIDRAMFRSASLKRALEKVRSFIALEKG